MKRISIDMDGVIANVYSQFITMHSTEFGTVLSLDEITGKPEEVAFANAIKYVTSPGFFRNAPVIKDAKEVVFKLTEHYQVLVEKLELGTITNTEQSEFEILATQEEKLRNQRVKYMLELAQLRAVPLSQIMESLGLKPLVHA